MEMEVDSTIL
jgi:hypothetical protein